MFTVPAASEPLTQGDLVDDCPLVSLSPDQSPKDIAAIPVQRWYSRVIALTQACDLAQPKTDLVLVAPVHAAEKLVQRGVRVHPQKVVPLSSHFLSYPRGDPETASTRKGRSWKYAASPRLDRRCLRRANSWTTWRCSCAPSSKPGFGNWQRNPAVSPIWK